MKSSHAKATGFSTYPVNRRTVLKRTGQAALVVAGASLVGVEGILASNRAPAVLQGEGEVSGTVRLLASLSLESLEGLFNSFMEQHPNVELVVEEVVAEGWGGFSDEVSTRIAGGEVYDVVQIATEGQRVFASRGLLEPIDDYIERDREELSEFFESVPPNLLEWTRTLSSPDGQTYFLPGEFNTMGIWYNAEMFASAGVPEPTEDWTWDTFREAATALTGDGSFGMHVLGGLFGGVMPWLLTNGASPLNADWTEATINTPEAIEATEFMRSLVADGISPEPGGEFDAYTMMAQGRLGMFGAGRWPLGNIRELEIVDSVKIAHWPQQAGHGSPIGWKSYPIMQVSENKDAAWEFTKFMTTLEASQAIAVLGTEVPVRREAIESDVFLENSPEGMGILYEAVDYATPVPGPDNGSIIETAIGDMYAQILVGNVEVEQGLNDLNATIQSNL